MRFASDSGNFFAVIDGTALAGRDAGNAIEFFIELFFVIARRTKKTAAISVAITKNSLPHREKRIVRIGGRYAVRM